MEIIFNKNFCEGITGRLDRRNPWYIHKRKEHYYAVCRGVKNTDVKRAWLRVFVLQLRKLQDAKFISEIILNDQERRMLE